MPEDFGNTLQDRRDASPESLANVMAPGPDVIRTTMARVPTAVALMTTVHEGLWHGTTVNAVTCLSLRPRLILVCLRDDARMTDLVRRSHRFNLSFLAEHHQSVARRFAGSRPAGAAAFGGTATVVDDAGCPYLADATVVVRCRLWRVYPGGDHVIVCGDMLAMSAGTSPPLVFHAGA